MLILMLTLTLTHPPHPPHTTHFMKLANHLEVEVEVEVESLAQCHRRNKVPTESKTGK